MLLGDILTNCLSRCHKKNREKGEFDDLPPIEDLQISVPQVLCDPVGEVLNYLKIKYT